MTSTLRAELGLTWPTFSLDLPGSLERLVASLPPGHSCNLERLIYNHTAWPYFNFFLPERDLQQIWHGMTDDIARRCDKKQATAVGSSPVSSRMRLCPKCVKEDRQRYNEAYWHLAHQLPGVEVCSWHDQVLIATPVSALTAAWQRKLVSADSIGPFECQTIPTLATWRKHQRYIASNTEWMLAARSISPGVRKIQACYTRLLFERRLLAGANGGSSQKFSFELWTHFSSTYLEHIGCSYSATSQKSWSMGLIGGSTRAQHPLKHLLILNMLDIDMASLVALAKEFRPFGNGPWPCLNRSCDQFGNPVVTDVTVDFEYSRGVRGTFVCPCGHAYDRIGPDLDDADRFTTVDLAPRTPVEYW